MELFVCEYRLASTFFLIVGALVDPSACQRTTSESDEGVLAESESSDKATLDCYKVTETQLFRFDLDGSKLHSVHVRHNLKVSASIGLF